jgi:hypothetical protein
MRPNSRNWILKRRLTSDESTKQRGFVLEPVLTRAEADISEDSVPEGIGLELSNRYNLFSFQILTAYFVRESNPCRRREREATYCNYREFSGMDSTLPHLKDSGERLLDS